MDCLEQIAFTGGIGPEQNGQPRDVTVVDKSLEPEAASNIKADSTNPKQVGASMPGMVVTVAVQAGDSVKKGQKLFSLEAMKHNALAVSLEIVILGPVAWLCWRRSVRS